MLLFGAKRLPDMARSFGQSLRIIRSEAKAMMRAESHVAGAEPTHSVQRSDLTPLLRTAPSEPDWRTAPAAPAWYRFHSHSAAQHGTARSDQSRQTMPKI
ncbi:twin-arginine translocase TatA/TatE family subunit [Streptomyces sp. HD]|uniref:twin-arginine translocase TatA/TatE family subunit n=1 Tax=Streptomyces sp. HD TaxID=3020892 RepID=UPI003FA71D8D